MKPKDLIGIPWMAAFALRSDGWYLRQDNIWSKPNPMPESMNDRCTKSHEYIFMLTKKQKYFFDAYAIATDIRDATVKRMMQDIESQKGSERAFGGLKHNGTMKAVIKGYEHKKDKNEGIAGHSGYFDKDGKLIGNGKANRKSVWTIVTKGFADAHFATFPEKLPEICIKASTSEKGVCKECGAQYYRDRKKYHVWHKGCKCDTSEIVPATVLDTFGGANTTGLVTRKLLRDFYAFDRSPDYKQIGDVRLDKELGMFR